MDLQLSDQVAVVTGASRGIGRAISLELARAGMRLAVVARTESDLEDVAGECGRECLVQIADLRDPAAPAEVVRSTIDRFGRIDVLVNCAGATKRGDFLELTDSDWEDGFSLKYFGSMRCCRSAWPHLQATGGRIINIIGVGGKVANPEFTIGGSVNIALMYLTKALAARGVKDGVRVNAINPGSIATGRLTRRVQKYALDHGVDEKAAAEQMAASLGARRFGRPEELARVVSFLASPLSDYCWGSIVDVDGGQTRVM